jgi:uncharacterized membrane protein YhhN
VKNLTAVYILAGCCVPAGFAAALLRNRHAERGRLASKLLASLLFCATALLAAAQRERMTLSAALLLGALLLGFIGDVLLGLDQFAPKQTRPILFILGGVPFFLGHILYIVLLLPIGNFSPWLLLLLPVVPILFAALARANVIYFGKNLVPCTLYGTILSAMMMSTLNVARQGAALPQGAALAHLMFLPGILFALSDSSLFLRNFGGERLQKWIPALSFTVMLPYYAAQAIFALSVRYI